MKHLTYKIILFFSFFLCFNLTAMAAGFGYSAPSQAGGSGSCLSKWGGCWTGPDNKAYRVTLVDFNGKKIAKTKSVDFSSLDFYNCENGRNCDFKAYSPISGYYDSNGKYIARYGYKYTKLFTDADHPDGDYNIATENDKFLMVYDSKNHFKDQASVNALVKFYGDTLDAGYTYGDYDPNSLKKDEKITFLDLFLLYSGFMSSNYVSWKALPSDKIDIIEHSTFIVEPTYSVYFYSNGNTIYRYGTAVELAQYMLDHPGYGLDYGVSKALRKNVALCVDQTDKKEKLDNFTVMEKGVNICQNSDSYSGVTLEKLVDPTLAYGLNIFISDETNPCITGNCGDTSDYSFDWCGKKSGVKKISESGITTYEVASSSDENSDVAGNSISLSSIDFASSPQSLMASDFKVFGDDDSQSVYCFDTVDYNFKDLSNSLYGTFNKFSFVNPKNATLDVTRQCLLGVNYNEQGNKNHLDIDKYVNSALEIGFYNYIYKIYPSDSISNDDFDITDHTSGGDTIYDVKPKKFNNDNVVITQNLKSDVTFNTYGEDGSSTEHKFVYTSYNFRLNYVVPKDLLFIGEKNVAPKKYVKLSDITNSFGYSQNFLSNTFLKGSNASEYSSTGCPLDYNINSSNTGKTNINFRVISLNNPFPGRDGSSRMPAENWLYYDNNVYNYITTGRGVFTSFRDTDFTDEYGYTVQAGRIDPELMYKYAEPMYTITLTPSTMLKIRAYNKTHSYYSMYEYDTSYVKYRDGIASEDNKSDSQIIKENDNKEGTYKLRCNEEGRECYSEFLRRVIPQDEKTIGGVCYMGRGQSNVRKEFNSYYSKFNMDYDMKNAEYYRGLLFNAEKDPQTGKYDKTDIMQVVYGQNYGADVNFNGVLDSEDIEIMTAYANNGSGKLIKYYTCANKTYKSGGPVEEVE